MAKPRVIIKVTVGAKGVALEEIRRGRPGYGKARKAMIVRQRDAIELFRRLKKSGKGFAGSHAFEFPETAKTFAMLCLQARMRELQANLDRVLAFDGGRAADED